MSTEDRESCGGAGALAKLRKRVSGLAAQRVVYIQKKSRLKFTLINCKASGSGRLQKAKKSHWGGGSDF